MPKAKTPPKQSGFDPHHFSAEAGAYLQGLFQELRQQAHKYLELTRELLNLEARIELAEKTLSLTRDHLAMAIKRTEGAFPRDWTPTFNGVRFVGVRLADACMTLLQENKKMTPEEIFVGLNKGMFRFRTNSPQREIHAALLRQTFAKRVGPCWVWTGEAAQQIPMRLRLATKPISTETSQTEQKDKASK